MLAHKERVNLNTLTSQQRQQLAHDTYEVESYFQRVVHQDNKDFSCPTISQKLREQIERLLIVKGIAPQQFILERLHEDLTPEMRAYNFDDGVNKLTTHFYDTDEEFMAVYNEFIRYLRASVVAEPFYFQATPTIRLHCPNALNSNHYPRYHTDIGYGHPPEEINLWLPLTEAQLPQHHGFRVMSLEDSKLTLERFNFDYPSFIHAAINDKAFSAQCDNLSPQVTTPFGQLFAFDSRCMHSGEPLLNHTRVSIDIRVLPLSEYEKMTIEYQGAGRRKILFTPGNCYHALDSDKFLNL